MIVLLATRYRKASAFGSLLLLFLELLLPLAASAAPVMRNVCYLPGKLPAGMRLADPGVVAGKPAAAKVALPAAENPGQRQKAGFRKERRYTGGPGQPEMSAFKSVNATDLVDLFSGDFSYSIPLMDVGGYPVNLHYSSDISMDAEASWVGLGWNINPGTISRSMRGLPDDFNGNDSITKEQSMAVNKTVGVSVGGNLEVLGTPVGLTAKGGIFHNNYNGWGQESSVNVSLNGGSKSYGPLTGSLAVSHNSQTGIDINPSIGVRFDREGKEWNGRGTLGLSTGYNSRAGISALQLNTEVRTTKRWHLEKGDREAGGTSFPHTAAISFAVPSYTPSITLPVTASQFSFSTKLGVEKAGSFTNLMVEGYVSKQEIKEEDRVRKQPAVGYLYYPQANGRPDALLDFNREKELSFNVQTTPHIALPQYTYDAYSISGEGTGGMFRPYRGDIGAMRDHRVTSKSNNNRLSLDLGPVPLIFHGGVDYLNTQAYTRNGAWESANDLKAYLPFTHSDTTYQSVYFRNPGEKGGGNGSFQHLLGDDDLVRVKLSGSGAAVGAAASLVAYKNGRPSAELPVTRSLVKPERDKRLQVISYKTAEEAAQYGLDKDLLSWNENALPTSECAGQTTVLKRVDETLRKKHHLSEISVLNGDGRRYVYGLPAYNIEQQDVTFSVAPEAQEENRRKGLVTYSKGEDNDPNRNRKGKDHFFTRETTPGYAHSFLLTAILSPDYVDVTGNGITEDDAGNAVKFNYTRIYGSEAAFAWRTPFQDSMANYNEGLKTYSRDDKGTYLFGRKEVWYLHSVESKTMVALFKVSADRRDAFSVKDPNGGLNLLQPLRKLTQIVLYAKSDLVKNGERARPVKTVHFSYNYDLCKGAAGNPEEGKLTLESVWFSYNGNEKGRRNPYVFRYHPGAGGRPLPAYNPAYHPKQYDRWGNFKDEAANPGRLANSDYPYAVQDSAAAARGAAAWTLSDIQLPGSGRLHLTYEADDYAYVQDRRAAQFFPLAAVSASPENPNGNRLYKDFSADCYYVFVRSVVPLQSRADLQARYLQGMESLFCKLAVKMPSDKWGSGYELVPVYATAENYGLVTGDDRLFWIRLKPVEGQSPLARAALQFLRLNLPSKAYPGSELGDDLDLGDAVKMLASRFNEVRNLLAGFDKASRQKGWCAEIDLERSFIRLASPSLKKYGGGLRVKRVELWDNWNKMTGMKEASYGQEYTYTTLEELGGQKVEISSGVASWEPMIGGEENPFKNPIPYAEKLAPLAPASYLFSEEPLGETFFPAPMVGYARVRVRTIHQKAKSANGWQEAEFYTARDFPTLAEHSLLDDASKKRYQPKLRNFLKINATHQVSLSQGFRIELNDMHGRMKAQAGYAESDPVHPVNSVTYYYRTEDDKAYRKRLSNTAWVADSVSGRINTAGQIGKDIELMVDMREQVSRTIAENRSVNLDILPGIGIIPFIPIPTLFPMPQREETRFRSVATVKIVQRQGILDSIVALNKGSVVHTKNLLYDGQTGEVVLARTANEFNDPVYTFSYPAHWAYSGMGPAYKNTDAVFRNLGLIRGKLFFGDDTHRPFPVERYFEGGEEVFLEMGDQAAGAVPACLGMNEPTQVTRTKIKAWVLDAARGREQHTGLFFIDAEGRPLTGRVYGLRILRSGRRNLLADRVGSIETLANPIRQEEGGALRLVFDSASKVVQASAVTYKDFWSVENSRFLKDTVVQVYKEKEPVILNPRVSIVKLDKNGNGEIKDTAYQEDADLIAASFEYLKWRKCDRSKSVFSKSILAFDLNIIPSNGIITNATLSFAPRVPKNLWHQKSTGYDEWVKACPKEYGVNWNAEKVYYSGQPEAEIKRIEADWNRSTPYDEYKTTSQNQLIIDRDKHVDLNCTELIRDLHRLPLQGSLGNPRYGLMFELKKKWATNDKNNELNYLSFCAKQESNINKDLCSQASRGTAGINCDCFLPQLVIHYKTLTDSVYTVCRDYINDSSVNPYRWGILGNWRPDKGYSFYGDRVEGDASVTSTDIRREGLLKNFSPHWKFAPVALQATIDTAQWVWNSSASAFNRKGLETENFDPLGRYNSGLYGYNATLPVAVASNSRYRELLYDGFEDYDYHTKTCTTCPSPRDFDFTLREEGAIDLPVYYRRTGSASVPAPGVHATTAQSHTGRYSLKVEAGAEAKITVPVVEEGEDARVPALSIRVDSTPVTTTMVVGRGEGLMATYTGYPEDSCSGRLMGRKKMTQTLVQKSAIHFQWDSILPAPGMCNRNFDVVWKGKLQAPGTGTYRIFTQSFGEMSMEIKAERNIIRPGLNGTYQLEAGALYGIELKFSPYPTTGGYAQLWWSGPDSIPRIIPKEFLYTDNADTSGSVVDGVNYYCIGLNNPKPERIFRPRFSPLQNSRMVVSAWVRLDGEDCATAPAPEHVITALLATPGGPLTVALQQTGVRIEGWQRYEAQLVIPAGATTFSLSIRGTDRAVYVDDIRVQPYHSSLKTFVYHPENLRLLAEGDENNYASFYEYDDDGTLIRVKKETERGIMTIRESRSALTQE
ncbi:PA14 domain-containing protein [Paraflavisolibacter sp. H34]|uniref:PA14 domain-containing protein n=1 Tax=Huijunlia imazamoxiresistens TaxID=3127457 RepID=UPI003017A456